MQAPCKSAAHTPGPWVWGEDCGTIVIRGAETQREEGGVSYGFRDYVASTWGEPHSANARLIAAAPTLLEALQALIEWAARADELIFDSLAEPGTLDVEEPTISAARAALAAATGSEA